MSWGTYRIRQQMNVKKDFCLSFLISEGMPLFPGLIWQQIAQHDVRLSNHGIFHTLLVKQNHTKLCILGLDCSLRTTRKQVKKGQRQTRKSSISILPNQTASDGVISQMEQILKIATHQRDVQSELLLPFRLLATIACACVVMDVIHAHHAVDVGLIYKIGHKRGTRIRKFR